MSSLFADTHNVVTILEKSYAAEGFEQIINFLSGSYIHYALTVNPHIYISCIKQFWNTASVKRSGDVTRLQALVDKKKIVISEVVIREILQLDDAEGVVCLPNEEIFAGLAQMGYEKPSTKLTFYKAFFSSQWKFLIHTILQSLSAKRTSWNEFSTTMASVVICLSKGQKFNFSKYIFDSLVCNVDSSSKFYMYPRFIQLIIQNKVGDLSTHTTRFISPVLTQKVFANMRRVRKGFSGVETPLVEGMLVDRQPAKEGLVAEQVQVDDAIAAAVEEDVVEDRVENLEKDNAAQKLVIIKLKARVKKLEKANMVKSSKLRHLRKVEASKQVESFDDMEDVFNQGRMIDDMDKDEGIELVKDAEEDDSEVQEVVEVVTTAKLITEVVTAAASQGVIIRDPEEELSLKTPAETPKVKDKGKGILVETPKPMKKKDQIELDAEYARKLHEEINKDHDEFNKDIDWDAAIDHNIAGYKMDSFKGMTYAQIYPIFQARFDENMRFLFKSREEIEEEDQEIIKSINETPAQKAAKRRKLSEEAQEAEDLRKCLEVVDDEDDDVFIEATPLAQKVPVVDYQIVLVDNKPRFKIIKADETHQFYISFTTLLKNFNREDLESLWRIVKDIFSTSKPTNFLDEYLLLTLKTMFEEPDGQDAIWKNQKSVHGLALVKSWKLLTLCGVHVITLSIIQLFLLVERRYPLSRFTLEQLVNLTRLQVEEESEMSLELLRGNKYIFVAVDYLSKWVKAKALPTNDARVVCKFLKNLFARFGTPRAIISDRGTHFLVENRASWSDKLGDALWAFRITYKTPIGCTPYKMVYGKACHLSVELEHKAYWALKHANFDLKTAGDHMKVHINELNELRDQAYENSLIYKEKTKRLHDSKIKDRVLNIDDRVLLFNSRLKIFSGKLKSRWSGPFTISQVYPYGTVELSQPDGPNFKVNGHHLKHYFREDVPNLVVPDL
nr:reverse transcriptase domain-containing protein [Tanacetum cinerariifolium]